MERLQRYFLNLGVFFVLGGFLAGLGGALRMLRFFREASDLSAVTVVELTAGVVIPHMFMLLGIGFLIYGAILFVKGLRFHRDIAPGGNRHKGAGGA